MNQYIYIYIIDIGCNGAGVQKVRPFCIKPVPANHCQRNPHGTNHLPSLFKMHGRTCAPLMPHASPVPKAAPCLLFLHLRRHEPPHRAAWCSLLLGSRRCLGLRWALGFRAAVGEQASHRAPRHPLGHGSQLRPPTRGRDTEQ